MVFLACHEVSPSSNFTFSLKVPFSLARRLQKDPKNRPSTRAQSAGRGPWERSPERSHLTETLTPQKSHSGLPPLCPRATATTKTRRKEEGGEGEGQRAEWCAARLQGQARCCGRRGEPSRGLAPRDEGTKDCNGHRQAEAPLKPSAISHCHPDQCKALWVGPPPHPTPCIHHACAPLPEPLILLQSLPSFKPLPMKPHSSLDLGPPPPSSRSRSSPRSHHENHGMSTRTH